MAKTQAERASEYRRKKRDVGVTENVTQRHESVTEPECDGVSVTHCKTCGTEVNHHLIDMCLSCVQAKHAPSVKIGKE